MCEREIWTFEEIFEEIVRERVHCNSVAKLKNDARCSALDQNMQSVFNELRLATDRQKDLMDAFQKVISDK